MQHRIVLGNRVEPDADAIALADVAEFVQYFIDRIDLANGVLPGALAHIVPKARNIRCFQRRAENFAYGAVFIELRDCKARSARVANQIIIDIVDRGLAVDRKTIRGEFILHHIRVSGELLQHAVRGDPHVVRT